MQRRFDEIMAERRQQERSYPNVISNEASAQFVHLAASVRAASIHSDGEEEKDEVEGTMEGLVGNGMSNMRI